MVVQICPGDQLQRHPRHGHGPWLTTELIDTLDGTSSSQWVLFPRPPWGNSDQNFTIWMPEFPH